MTDYELRKLLDAKVINHGEYTRQLSYEVVHEEVDQSKSIPVAIVFAIVLLFVFSNLKEISSSFTNPFGNSAISGISMEEYTRQYNERYGIDEDIYYD